MLRGLFQPWDGLLAMLKCKEASQGFTLGAGRAWGAGAGSGVTFVFYFLIWVGVKQVPLLVRIPQLVLFNCVRFYICTLFCM